MKHHKKKGRDRIEAFRAALHHSFQKSVAAHQVSGLKKPEVKPPGSVDPGALKIGIVGGGMAGMYAQLLLKELGIKSEIFEASDGRVGGRVYTHYFSDKPHQYAELGAMRFPKNELQNRLFNFWDYLNETAPDTPEAEELQQIPYILFDQSGENLLCFNGKKPVTRREAELDNSLLGFDEYFKDARYDYFKDENGRLKSAAALEEAAIHHFIDLLALDGVPDDSSVDILWERILPYNHFSARGYLQEVGDGVPYPVEIVDYMETVNSYTGIYDLSFIEYLLDNYSFNTPHSQQDNEWYAFEGGTSRLAGQMLNRIPDEAFHQGARVTKLSEENGKAIIHYQCNGEAQIQTASFDRVIVTVPFSVLRFIETPDSWHSDKYQAMRSLKMTNAVKVALGFKSRFWEKPGLYSEGMRGGQSNTDLPSRSIVYPSFGIGEPGPAYILSSYSWNEDADKFSHLNHEQALEVTLRDVIRLHGDIAKEEYLGHGASIVWNKDEFAGGGFEFFAAGQFENMFVAAREPEGLFNFAGEHLDMMHYWITGSYNSAFRTVWEILIQEGLADTKNQKILFNAFNCTSKDILPTMIPRFHSSGEEELSALLSAESKGLSSSE